MKQSNFQALKVRKPKAFLVVSLALLLKPSTAAAEIVEPFKTVSKPFAVNARASLARTSSMALFMWDMMWNRLYRTKDLFPARSENLGYFLPAHPLRPSGQKPSIGIGQTMLARSPRNGFDSNAASGAIYTPHRVNEKNAEAPNRNKLEPAGLEGVIAWAGPAAKRTEQTAVGEGPDIDLNSFVFFRQGHGPVDKTAVFLNLIQYSLKLHPVVCSSVDVGFITYIIPRAQRDALHKAVENAMFGASCTVDSDTPFFLQHPGSGPASRVRSAATCRSVG